MSLDCSETLATAHGPGHAPILAVLLGYGLEPKLVVVAIVCFFPIVVNAVDWLWMGAKGGFESQSIPALNPFKWPDLPIGLPRAQTSDAAGVNPK
jgi:hypothetical protein